MTSLSLWQQKNGSDDFYLRVLSESPIPEWKRSTPQGLLRTRRVPAAWGSRVVGTARAKGDTFGITLNRGYDSGGSLGLIWNAAQPARVCRAWGNQL